MVLLILAQLAMNIHTFTEPRGWKECLQKPVILVCVKLFESHQHSPSLSLWAEF